MDKDWINRIQFSRRKTPQQAAWEKLERREQAWLESRVGKQESWLVEALEGKVPDKLQETLEKAFEKAFSLIFEKGTELIEKSYDKDELEKRFKINEFEDELRKSRRSLAKFTIQAKKLGKKNVLVSGAAGIGMGIVGVGIPDIAVFSAMLFRCVYEIALSYGFDYTSEEEKYFVLLLIQTAVAGGDEAVYLNKLVDVFCESPSLPKNYVLSEQIRYTSQALSGELLYMKFLQGIPVVGAVGGAYDLKYLNQVERYAGLKYQRRFLCRLLM